MQTDITALHQAEEERDTAQRALAALADHLQDEIESQRRELAREVHDDIGATLTGIRLHLARLAERACCGELDDLRALVDQALASTRALCAQLRPPILDDLGLAETLRWYARDWSRQTGIRVRVRIARLDAEPKDPVRIDVFRMLQELLTNVARHSGARHVALSLSQARGTLRLRIADDGCGFATAPGNGFGLLGIRERLRRHGGEMRIASAAGASLVLRIPLAAR